MGRRGLSAVLLDTHIWAWSFVNSAMLSEPARQAIAGAEAVHVSPITLFEITQQVRLGKWPGMEPYARTLP